MAEHRIGRGVGPGPASAGPIRSTPLAPRPEAKPGVTFKQAMARAMEGWGPDAPAAALRPPRAPARPAASPPPPSPVPTPRDPFRQLVARLESGGSGVPDQGYGQRNAASGALGRYQMLPIALRDIGWQDAAGRWTPAAAAHGVGSEEDFLATPAAQEAAMSAFLRRAEQQLDRNGSLARAGDSITGLDGAPVPLTEGGLVAAAHRRGAGSVARYLAHRSTAGADAPLTPAERTAFEAVERRLRQFAALPYALAGAPRRGGPSAA